MGIFSELVFLLSQTPAWVSLFAVPFCALAAAVVLPLVKLRRIYPFVAVSLALLGFALVAAKGDLAAACVYLGLAFAAFSLFALFLLLPPVAGKKRESREERIYKKFHTELTPPDPEVLPPKVCCYEEPATAEDSGMRLAYVTTLIGRLRSCKLSPADRLELEALGHAVEGCRGRALTGEELASLNDSLAAVLKLTAKYKL